MGISDEQRRPVDDWQQCPPGELSGLVMSLRKRRQRAQWLKASALASVVALLIGAGWFTVAALLPSGDVITDLSCREVRQMFAAFDAGELNDELTARIESHLQHCPGCREAHEHATPATSDSTASRTPVEPWRWAVPSQGPIVVVSR
jgi:predicted anti-sigma-YlaC factor YlaD